MPTKLKCGAMVREGYVVLNELADHLGMDRSNFRKVVLKFGVLPDKKRLASTGGQLVNVMLADDAERFLIARNGEFLDIEETQDAEKLSVHQRSVEWRLREAKEAETRRKAAEARRDAALCQPYKGNPKMPQ